MNYFSSKNHVSWCCFLFKCKLTQKNPFILSFEQKATDFLKGRTKGEGKGEAKARKAKGEAKAMQPSCTEPNPRGTKGKKQEGWEKEKEKRKGGERGKRRKKGRRRKGEKERKRDSLAQDYWTRLWFSFGY